MCGCKMPRIDNVETRGFLSVEIESHRTEARRCHEREFADCDAWSDAAMSQLASLGPIGGSPAKLFAVGFWMKCVRACQGAILLAERGLIPDSMTLTRTAVEALFHAAALAVKPALVEKMVAEDRKQKRKQAQEMTKEATIDASLSDHDRKALRALLEEEEEEEAGAALSAYEAAEAADLLALYQTMYRGLSLGAAHSTLTALDHEFSQGPQGQVELDFGPSTGNLEFALGMVSSCLRIGIEKMAPLIEVD
ncbi:hypothetical protein HR51_00785 [Burkholderia cepacia]|nr:hypothetical protein HR51_00785 [Burkholderia cepacia]